MHSSTLKITVLGLFGLVSSSANATGLVNIPSSGFPVGNDISAYTICNGSGNFGAGTPTQPSTMGNNTCAVFPTNDATSPESGYTLVASANRTINISNTYTGGATISVGSLTDYVWRNPTSTTCIYGAKITVNKNDYWTTQSGNQNISIYDLTRGGFNGLAVDAGYSTVFSLAAPVYRIGRTFTSVRHDANGSQAQPLTLPAYNLAINPNQSASLNSNWIDFTTAVSTMLPSGQSSAVSGMMYVKANACPTVPITAVANAIRLRQTQPPYIEIALPGFVPAGSNVLPAPVNPY